MQVDFCTPKDLTTSIIDPDTLEIVFSLPSLIVDALTFERLDADEIVYELEIVPQMSSEELQ